MAKSNKNPTPREIAEGSKVKTKSIFDFINDMTTTKVSWETYSESDKKAWNTYMINRWLSMDTDLTLLISTFQKVTLGIMEPKDVHKLYTNMLPKKKLFLRYTKGGTKVYNNELVNYIKEYYEISSVQAEGYLDIYYNTERKYEVYGILRMYGLTDKEIDKLMKTKSSD